ncbi:MAG: NAD-dependent epimerase/dehydratase family protein [Solirubrobacterales bacterium]|nr:NAD-dependent epimerase/dehydratase family protein [Solirubrobacterales bacterium]
MRLLVLGGSSFVGRAVVDDGLGRGWAVTTFNRGHGSAVDERVERLRGDRLRAEDLAPLTARTWDFVVDTWLGAPRAARNSAAALADRARRYLYVSSGSVYAPPPPSHGDESARTVAAAPDAEHGDYASRKRGSEIAIEAAFGDRALLARAGTILGPHEDVGRLPWWLLRMDRGGEVLAPGPADLPLQYIDARDLASWLLDAASDRLGGAFNVVSRSGHATMGTLLGACRRVTGDAAVLTWLEPSDVRRAGIEAWSQLPIWLPPDHEYRGLHEANVERAHAAGLHCRPVAGTVADTWEWLLALDKRPPLRSDLDPPGLDAATERAALAALHDERGPA